MYPTAWRRSNYIRIRGALPQRVRTRTWDSGRTPGRREGGRDSAGLVICKGHHQALLQNRVCLHALPESDLNPKTIEGRSPTCVWAKLIGPARQELVMLHRTGPDTACTYPARLTPPCTICRTSDLTRNDDVGASLGRTSTHARILTNRSHATPQSRSH